MSERWKMNRIGFVNFWLYDDEDFELEDGKLLLRGQNGSGKSITTQSFIPFILDGDRSPSRLDPFGTGSRTMDYYFLGDNEKEESTGYLYLEFKKENEYRTIAIGQNAHKGRPMTFWGFVLLDGRRIGKDLKLYRESGDNIVIPLSKQEMKKALSEDTPFTTSPKEYKSFVNEYLFGFDRIEQYDQYIKLLIKVRAPKLSNTFKPTRMYEILNESLQVLSDDDLRPMVDEMEKMDYIQEQLEALKRAYADANTIMREYDHYNRYMISKKAHNYLEALKVSKASEKEYFDILREVEQWKKDQLEKKKELEDLKIEEDFVQKQIEQCIDPEIENLDIKYQNAKKELDEYTGNIENKHKQIQQKNDSVYEAESEMKKFKNLEEYSQKQIDDDINYLEEIHEEIKDDFHCSLKKQLSTHQAFDGQLYLSKLDALKNSVKQGISLLRKSNDLEKKYASDKEENDLNRKLYNDAEFQFKKFTDDKEKVQDALLLDISKLSGNHFWHLDDLTMRDASKVIEDYEVPSDATKLIEIFYNDYSKKQEKKKYYLAQLKAQEKQLFSEYNKKKDEYREVENQKEVEPYRDENAIASREKLKQAGIQAFPFYQTVEFSDSLSESEQAILEQQLFKAGLLDALVVSKYDYLRIQNEFPQLIDTLIYEESFGKNVFHDLTVEENLPNEVKQSVKNILSNVTNDNGTLVLKKDGYYRHGMIEGHVKKECSEYIGVNARKRKKEQLLLNIEKQINEIKQLLDDKRAEMASEENDLLEMQQEYSLIPDTKELNSILDCIHKLEVQLQVLHDKQDKLDEKMNRSYQLFKEAEREMLSICKALPYARNIDTYEDILNAIDSYKEYVHDLSETLVQKESYMAQIEMQQSIRDTALSEIDDLCLERDIYKSKIEYCEKQLSQIQELMNNPEIIENARKVKALRAQEKTLQEQIQNLNRNLAILEHDLNKSKDTIDQKENDKNEKQEYLAVVQQYFQEEVELKFVILDQKQSLEQSAKQAISQEEKNFIMKPSTEMDGRLRETSQRNTSNLVNYNVTITPIFAEEQEQKTDRRRLIVEGVVSGEKLGLQKFIEELGLKIENQNELIRENDRKIFEEILSQTISEKLTDRIEESRTWVKEMSRLMKKMDTSMGLTFSLEWKEKTPEDIDEMDVRELEKILIRDKQLITSDDITRVSKHFRSIIQREKQQLEMNNLIVNYMELVRNALDYRKWYTFRMSYTRKNEPKKDLTNAAFNRFSGGEKAMAMYVPLFASVNAQYQKCKKDDHPRLIALDEAFAGVDEINIASMFEMVEALDLDYIMNSQVLWGCYPTVQRLHISELLRPLNADFVTVVNYLWNGKEKVLNGR